MEQWGKHAWTWIAMSALTLSQIIASLFLYSRPGLTMLRNAGWVILWTAGLFGVIPVITLRQRGNVSKGQEYVQTTVLVDSGIYALVRHPQYLSFILIDLGLLLIAQHWLVLTMGVVAAALNYVIILEADRAGVEKFGDEYRRYMLKVPRVNFVVGITRLLRGRKRK
jgi:protein-S-isoprenylcysteine O-methyltransferase Ste14